MPGHRRPGQRADKPSIAKLKYPPSEACPSCGRPRVACLCDRVEPLSHRLAVVILEHPQETHKWMNSAALAGRLFADCTVRVGLSWRNLEAATGRPWKPSEWAVLVLRGEGADAGPEGGTADAPVTLRSRGGKEAEDAGQLRGIIALDGNWQQAKTLWWRNPWLTKCRTIELHPDLASQRAQVKKSGLSTVEAVGFCLAHLENAPELLRATLAAYRRFVVEPARAAWKRKGDDSKTGSGDSTQAATVTVPPASRRRDRSSNDLPP